MSTSTTPPVPAALPDAATPRRAWVVPAVTALPPLEHLTLQTGGDIGGLCTPGGGCTFSFLSGGDPLHLS